MQLTVIEYAGEPVHAETSVEFRPPGGTIGRNADNQMVLPDETRQVSRLQALLQIDGDHCVLKNLSSVSVVEINDTPLEYTEEHALESGDAIRIGPYVLRAQAGVGGNAGATTASAAATPVAQKVARPGTATAVLNDTPPIPTDPLALFARSGGADSSIAQPVTTQVAQFALRGAIERAADTPLRTSAFAKPEAGRERDALPRVPRPAPQKPAGTNDKSDAKSASVSPPASTASADADTASTAPDSADALLSAFLRGAGLEKATCDWSTEQLHTAGQLLALFTNGTVELLSSRSILKREVKADMTVLLDRENNPLKLLPDGSAALRQMFGLPFPGFMTPPGAVEDAFHDLQAHQIAMVAGMRAALNDLLQRFSPSRLAERSEPTRYEQLLPMLRKARLWNRYERMHHETMLAVEDDFSAVFGRAFLRAYDDEVRNYHARRRPARSADA
ncbi:type VI secretion system-associated FHA domain protein TagH [Paraburkholderia sp. CNPSo 3281]|uniref:type VI secretion system-associated FHA domain protein TagH n=1 Tax=Paraburkholderia sp. CNPSo 3281 TaxID=2940933 RepID=UPI0020B78050|nr:type VI secretion system-associated FHA domain protein TagH [Paraburkholderia sp. CNPSo 3281]MCP3720277.1 type VI secretion system-associated FHA domain protein TagH [Paraburkholderia sp. CNPSo 3281]